MSVDCEIKPTEGNCRIDHSPGRRFCVQGEFVQCLLQDVNVEEGEGVPDEQVLQDARETDNQGCYFDV